jgi:hypothetical protein
VIVVVNHCAFDSELDTSLSASPTGQTEGRIHVVRADRRRFCWALPATEAARPEATSAVTVSYQFLADLAGLCRLPRSAVASKRHCWSFPIGRFANDAALEIDCRPRHPYRLSSQWPLL